jgi:hypothetical protein
MKLSISQIKNINATKSAIKGRIYEGADGVIYEGNDKGLLIVYQKASETSVSKSETVEKAIVTEQNKVGLTQADVSNLILFRV